MHLLIHAADQRTAPLALYLLDTFICATKVNIPKIIVVAVKGVK